MPVHEPAEADTRGVLSGYVATVTVSGLWLCALLGLWLRVGVGQFGRAALFALAVIAWMGLVGLASRNAIGLRGIAFLGSVGGLLAISLPPATSTDVNSYAMYARIVLEHSASPYVTPPTEFTHDPWLARVAQRWVDSLSLYGPLFTVLSMVIMAVAGESFLLARIGFQSLALVAFAGCALLIWRRTKDTSCLAFFCLSPLVIALGVNDAHSDLLVGLGVLAAVIVLSKQSLGKSAGAIGAASLIKLTAGLGAAGSVLWVWARQGARRASMFVGLIGLLVIVGLALAGGGDYLAAMSSAGDRHSRFSIWAPVHSLLNPESQNETIARRINLVANATVLVVGLKLAWHYRKHTSPVMAVVAPLVSYQVLGPYAVGWYALWSIPALALARDSWLAKLAVAHGCLITMLYFLL